MNILSIPALENFPYGKLKKYDYDLQEIRLDYSSEPGKIIEKMQNFLPLDPITIVTIRDISEGGIKQIPFTEKISIYQELIAKHNCLVDCELDLFLKHQPDLPKSNLILSRHIKKGTENVEKLIEETIRASNKYSVRYLKLVVPLEKYSNLAKLRFQAEQSSNPLVLAGTGSLGKLSRILWKLSGSLGTFTGLEGFKTAEEQLTPEEYNLFGCQYLNNHALIGGVIGGLQVYDSLGLSYYNQRLRKIDDKIVYLPFPVTDIPDFLNWLDEINRTVKFYGFSVTMPHKENLPRLLSKTDKPVNLISVETEGERQLPYDKKELFFNTDIDAFKKALLLLEVSEKDEVLVYGSGATARAFIAEFASSLKIFISSRNRISALDYASEYNIDYLSSDELRDRKFGLIVNCTPLGMKNEDFFAVTGLLLPNKLIDLPYLKSRTKAVEKCLEHNYPCIDGQSFWLFQARKQEDIFTKKISELI